MPTDNATAETQVRATFWLRAALGIVCYGALGCPAEPRFNFRDTPGQLPKDVVPVAYRIDIAPDLEQLKFTAREEIDVDVAKSTAVVTVNAADLTFKSVTLKGAADERAQVAIDAPHETASLHFAHALTSGRHTLVIEYAGLIPSTPAGIYYNDYATPAGAGRMLVTQFEARDARRMFPGWDEPVFKATFQLSVVLPAALAVVSNTPVTSVKPAGLSTKGTALTRAEFAQTPRMSTYLLVLCAGSLQRIHDIATGTDIGVWTVAGKAEQGRSALQAAASILPYYNSYFAVPYPLPKLDLIGVPGNFYAGAMENWGAITFIDDLLLLDPASSSETTRQQIFYVVAHEMAHQWSGDLVTMAWWNDAWLNEGFASWMGAKVSDKLNPGWFVWLREHASKERAMQVDARATTHPIQIKIADESEIASAFDAISYSKGEAFLRMLEVYLGEETFRNGMRHYMKAHAYSSATTADLWAELDAASGKPVSDIAMGFTEQPGIPLIRVAAVCRDGKAEVALRQERFTINDPKAAKLTWNVPVQIGLAGNSAMARSILVGKTPVALSFPDCAAAVKANLGDVGYYRVEYDAAGLKKLMSQYNTLVPADRVNFLSDQWALVEAGRAGVSTYLDITRELKEEATLVVWTDAIAKLVAIDDLARGSPTRPAFRRYALQLLRPAFARLGWDARPAETNQDALLRAALIVALGRFGDEAAISESRRRFAAFLVNSASLAANIRTPVFQTVGRFADRRSFDQLRALGKAASSTEDKLRYYFALARAQDPQFLDQIIAIALSGEIADARSSRFLIEVAHYTSDPARLWKAVLAKRTQVLQTVPTEFRASVLPAVAQGSADPAIGRELVALPEEQESAGARYQAAKAAEDIQERAIFKKRLLPALAQWLAAN